MKIHSKILLIIKLIISPILIFWLIKNDNFNLHNLKLGLSNGYLFISFIFLTFLQLIFSSYRTQILFQIEKINLSNFLAMMKISWASVFINCIAPSSFFGDFFRIKELIKLDTEANKDNSVYASIFSKVFSVLGLITVSLVASLSISNHQYVVKPVFYFLASLILIISFFTFLLGDKISFFIEQLTQHLFQHSTNKFIQNRITNFNSYMVFLLKNKSISIKAFLSSLCIQTFNTASLILIIYTLNPETKVNPYLLITLVPVGIFFMTLPISFSGLGVGHLAFVQLLKIANIHNGADVFTIYFAFSFIFNLFGVIPFFYLWKS